MNTENARAANRSIYEEPVSFETCVSEAGSHRNIKRRGVGVDISRLGLGMITDYSLSRGELVRANLPVDANTLTLPVLAEVIWTRPEGGDYRAGLRFLI